MLFFEPSGSPGQTLERRYEQDFQCHRNLIADDSIMSGTSLKLRTVQVLIYLTISVLNCPRKKGGGHQKLVANSI